MADQAPRRGRPNNLLLKYKGELYSCSPSLCARLQELLSEKKPGYRDQITLLVEVSAKKLGSWENFVDLDE
jgi:hypothetical protein